MPKVIESCQSRFTTEISARQSDYLLWTLIHQSAALYANQFTPLCQHHDEKTNTHSPISAWSSSEHSWRPKHPSGSAWHTREGFQPGVHFYLLVIVSQHRQPCWHDQLNSKEVGRQTSTSLRSFDPLTSQPRHVLIVWVNHAPRRRNLIP